MTKTTCVACGWGLEKNLNSGEWVDEWGSPLCAVRSSRNTPHQPRTPEIKPPEAVTKL